MPTAAEIARAVPGATVHGAREISIEGVTHDSRAVRPNDLFAVLKGTRTDGRRFVQDAAQKGAVALLVDEILPSELTQIRVRDTRKALGPISAACYDRPTERLQVAGITGTNGKTTTAYLVESILAAHGAQPGVMGTIQYRLEDKVWEAVHTTPEACVVQKVAREMVDAGATHLVMEVSSHGLALDRLGGCRFQVVAFTNLTQDHLDFHGNMEEYAASKLLLFTRSIEGNPQASAVINADDPFSATILANLRHRALTVSSSPDGAADIRPLEPPGFSIHGVDAQVTTPLGRCNLSSKLLGQHNLSNLLLAMGIALQLGVDLATACRGLARLDNVPGRLERIPNGSGFAVLVDYAHTPDALERVLQAVKPLTSGRLICVFGCGGDRDPKKRPLMGGAVGNGADVCLVTSDNPRTEDPAAIIEMILPGVSQTGQPRIPASTLASAHRGYAVEVDRKTAIRLAVEAARPGDTLLIAGKGHEDYQIFGTEKIHFDDREQARHALSGLGGGAHG